MIIHLNGMPGVGKLTVARILAERLRARLLDSHTVYNVGFSLAEFRTPEFYDLVRSVREVAFGHVAKIVPEVPVIITNALGGGAWARENWDAVRRLAQRRGSKLFAVEITCSPEEHAVRVTGPERAYLRKLTDPSQLRFDAAMLSTDGAHASIVIDTTAVPAPECAERLQRWIEAYGPAIVGMGARSS